MRYVLFLSKPTIKQKKKRREILFKSIIWRQRISKNSLSRQKTTIAYLEMEISVKNIFSVVFRYCISFKMIFVNDINIYLRLLFREKQNWERRQKKKREEQIK